MYSQIIPIRTWFENGQMEREITGTDKTNCESREWNDRGEVLEHFTRVNGVIKHLK
jgi:antitoxin component YwqK of YwqJK toxin-antitoxin module